MPSFEKLDESKEGLTQKYFEQRRAELKAAIEKHREPGHVLIHAYRKAKSIVKSKRGSQYRGVSKNGKKWQVSVPNVLTLLKVMIMGNMRKHYFGGIESERDAARLYDKNSILASGLQAKTNFDYKRADILKILEESELE